MPSAYTDGSNGGALRRLHSDAQIEWVVGAPRDVASEGCVYDRPLLGRLVGGDDYTALMTRLCEMGNCSRQVEARIRTGVRGWTRICSSHRCLIFRYYGVLCSGCG
ncbi:hypothetical protein ZHAS_00012586 [Anopheles sinensis]|uniref:SRCR domain-containing protein n=1 Tax=Anopheles sinensis TaxID=74873 RepID=A0A084W386_ANOSI|nr:hypothetical protein ZHAS_00012586 [Anopheles sinensis]